LYLLTNLTVQHVTA